MGYLATVNCKRRALKANPQELAGLKGSMGNSASLHLRALMRSHPLAFSADFPAEEEPSYRSASPAQADDALSTGEVVPSMMAD